jgi:hypothetical protein
MFFAPSYASINNGVPATEIITASSGVLEYILNDLYLTAKADPLLNQIAGRKDVWGSGGISPSILNLGTRWG